MQNLKEIHYTCVSQTRSTWSIVYWCFSKYLSWSVGLSWKCILSLEFSNENEGGGFLFSKPTIGCIKQYCCFSVKVGNPDESAHSRTDHTHGILRVPDSLKFSASAWTTLNVPLSRRRYIISSFCSTLIFLQQKKRTQLSYSMKPPTSNQLQSFTKKGLTVND